MTAKAYALSLLMVLLLPAITTPTLIPKPEPQPTFIPRPIAFTSDDIIDAIERGYTWTRRLYADYGDPRYGYIKDYPANPIALYVEEKDKWIFLGQLPKKSKIKLEDEGFDYVQMLIKFKVFPIYPWVTWNFKMRVRIEYLSGGTTKYNITFISTSTVYTVDVWFGNKKIWDNITKDTPEMTVIRYKYDYKFYKAHRYTVRNGAELHEKLFDIWGEYTRRDKLHALIHDYGFPYNVYDPIFGITHDNDLFMFTKDAYHDCDVYDQLPRGMDPHKYPYKSKVCLDRADYIALSYNDPLYYGLFAVHILIKYGDPDKEVLYGHPPDWWEYYSAREIARKLESDWWNGYGIGYPLDKSYASGVRTAVFLVLETLLGYVYGDDTSKNYADMTVGILLQCQVSSTGMYESEDLGVIYRPIFAGAFYFGWKPGNSYAFATPTKNILMQIIDWFGMPAETKGELASNSEATALIIQALRVYLYHRYGIAYPSGKYLP